jgi:hypothetical protein
VEDPEIEKATCKLRGEIDLKLIVLSLKLHNTLIKITRQN